MMFAFGYLRVQMLFEGRVKKQPKYGKKARTW
jgi:hypothetical protein